MENRCDSKSQFALEKSRLLFSKAEISPLHIKERWLTNKTSSKNNCLNPSKISSGRNDGRGRGSVRIKGAGVGRCKILRRHHSVVILSGAEGSPPVTCHNKIGVWLARVARRFFADSRVNAPPLRMTALGQGSRGWRAEHGFAGVWKLGVARVFDGSGGGVTPLRAKKVLLFRHLELEKFLRFGQVCYSQTQALNAWNFSYTHQTQTPLRWEFGAYSRAKRTLRRNKKFFSATRHIEALAYQKNLLSPEFLFKLQGGRNGKIKKLEK